MTTRSHKHTDYAAQARGERVDRCALAEQKGFSVGDVILLFSLSIGHANMQMSLGQLLVPFPHQTPHYIMRSDEENLPVGLHPDRSSKYKGT